MNAVLPGRSAAAVRFVHSALRASALLLLALIGAAALVGSLCLAAASPELVTLLTCCSFGIVLSPKELREKAGKLVNRMKRLNSLASKEDRDLTEDEQEKYDEWKASAERLKNRASRLEELDELTGTEPDNDNDEPGSRSGNPQNGGQNLGGFSNRIVVRDNTEPGLRGFRGQRDFLDSVVNAYRGIKVDDRLKPLMVSNAAGGDELSTQSDPYAGFFVPEGMLPGWLKVEPEPDPMLGRLTNVPMGTPVVKINARVDKDHSSSVSGGLTVSRRIETQAGSSSRMQMEQIELKADGLYGLSYASEELISDSPQTIAALLSMGFRDEFQSHLIEERIRGTGVGEFSGVLNSPSLITVAKEQSQNADTIVGANIKKMRARCWHYDRAVWLYNHDCYEQLTGVHIAGTNSDVFLFNPSRGIDVPDTLLGRPAFASEYCSTLGDKGDLILAVWSEFLEGTYQPLQGAESVHVRFIENERAFRFTMRNAGAPWWRSALTPKHSTQTLSPFVTLAERAGG